MVYLDDSTTVAAKIADMVTAIKARAKTTDMNTAISTAVNNLKMSSWETACRRHMTHSRSWRTTLPPIRRQQMH